MSANKELYNRCVCRFGPDGALVGKACLYHASIYIVEVEAAFLKRMADAGWKLENFLERSSRYAGGHGLMGQQPKQRKRQHSYAFLVARYDKLRLKLIQQEKELKFLKQVLDKMTFTIQEEA